MSDEPEPRPNTFFRPPTPRPPASPTPGGAPGAAPVGPPAGPSAPPPKPGMSAFEIESVLSKDRSATTSILIPIVLVGLVLVALGVGMRYMMPAWRSEPVAVAPEPAGPPQLSAEQRTIALDGLAALRDLRAFVQTGPSYQDYAQKTNGSKAAVEKFASLPNVNPELQASFAEAINLYNFALVAWTVGLKGGEAATKEEAGQIYFSVANDPMIEVCGPLRDARNRSGEESTQIPPPVARGIAVTQNVPMIWTCAAERIAYLESVLGAN